MQSVFPIIMFGNHSGSVSPPQLGQIILGTRVNYGNSGNAAQSFIQSIGGVPTYSVLMEYLNTSSTWGTWSSSGVWSAVGGFSPGFTSWPGPKLIKLPIQTTGAPLTWTDVTGGGQDSNFTSFFTYCLNNGVQNIAPGWEGNLVDTTWPWGTLGADTSANQTGYVAVLQHIWNLANAISPGYFKWWWNPATTPGQGNFANYAPGGAYWPGDSYVDVLGPDLYNSWAGSGSFPSDATILTSITTGGTPNWNQFQTYAIAHNKALCIPEWGMDGSISIPNGGDDPAYINNTWSLYVTAASVHGLTVYAMPWDDQTSNPISGYPNSLAALKSNVATGIQQGLVAGNVVAANIARSTASQFPLSTDAFPAATMSISATLGQAGDIVIVPVLVVGTNPVSTVTATNLTFIRIFSPYTDASWPPGSTEIEEWGAVVTAAAAHTTVTITVTLSGSNTYSEMIVDELTSGIGALANWTTPAAAGVTNSSSSTALDYSSVTSSSSASVYQAYYGYMQMNNTVGIGGTNPINGQTFTYSAVPGAQIAFNGSLQPSQTYAPIGAASVATPSFGFGQVLSVVQGSAPHLALSQPANQTGTVGTAIATFSATASGGTTPYFFRMTGAPTGITINSTSGAVSGAPTAAQSVTTTIGVSDASSPVQSASVSFTFTTSTSSPITPHAPATINGVTVPTTVAWNDEFPGPHLDVTKWLPGWFGDGGGGSSSGSFGPNMTFLETNLSFGANGLEISFTGTDGGACSSGLINSANWAGGAWTANATLGIPASAGPTFPGFVGWAGSPDGGGYGGTNPGATGPIYVEFSIIPDGSGTTNWNWQQFWLVQEGPSSSNYDAVDELDVLETFNETASTVWYDGYAANHRVQSVAVESGQSHTVGVMWASTWCCFVYDGVPSPVYTFVSFTHPQPPMGIIVAQGFSAANGCVFHSPSVQTTRYVRVFR